MSANRAALLVGMALAVAIGVGVSSAPSGRIVAEIPSTPPGLPAQAAREAGGAPRILSSADAGRGEAVFRTCAACHTIGRQGPDVDGPNLYGVVGARVADRRPRYGYTQALRDVGGVWTGQRLNAWLTDPAAFAPGTAMHFVGLPDAQDRADVIAYLATQGPAR